MQARQTVMAASALMAMAAVGCGSEGNTPEQFAASNQNLVFEELFSDTGRIQIFENSEGILDVTVSGRIGVDDHAELTKKLRPSLVEMYQLLKPEAAVPEQLFGFDEQLAEQVARGGGDADRAADVAQPKDAIAFIDALCKQHPWGANTLVTNTCRYKTGVAQVCTDATYDPNDLSNGWNETPYSTFTWKSDLTNPADFRWINPWTFWWNSWGGGGSNKTICLAIHGSGVTGNLGITHHDLVAVPP